MVLESSGNPTPPPPDRTRACLPPSVAGFLGPRLRKPVPPGPARSRAAKTIPRKRAGLFLSSSSRVPPSAFRTHPRPRSGRLLPGSGPEKNGVRVFPRAVILRRVGRAVLPRSAAARPFRKKTLRGGSCRGRKHKNSRGRSISLVCQDDQSAVRRFPLSLRCVSFPTPLCYHCCR